MCNAIVVEKTEHSFIQLKDREPVMNQKVTGKNGADAGNSGSVCVTINLCRSINIIFDNVVRPHHVTIGAYLVR